MTLDEIIESETCPCGGALHAVDNALECEKCGYRIVFKEVG